MNNKTLIVSIVTVVYNAENTIEESILSVLEQTYKEIEYIIIDGGSTDATVQIIKKYDQQISYWITEKDRGIYDAMNKAVQHSRGDWVLFLGADDKLVSKNIIENISPDFLEYNCIYYGDVIYKHSGLLYDGKFNPFKFATRNINQQSIFYPKSVFEKYKFEIKYKIFADYYLNILLYTDATFKFKYFKKIVSIYNEKGSSGSNVSDPEFEKIRFSLIKQHFSKTVYIYRIVRHFLQKFIKTLKQ